MSSRPGPSSKNSKVNGPPIEASTALLLIDLITDFDFEDGKKLLKNSQAIAEPVTELLSRARSSGIPVIYVNDNFGHWKEDFKRQVARVMNSSEKCRDFIEKIKPEKDDLYILKPQRSGFYETPLEVLLDAMNVRSLILTGVTTDICVLFTAHDAYMRGFEVSVPANCTAAVSVEHKVQALKLIQRVVDADISPSSSLTLEEELKHTKN